MTYKELLQTLANQAAVNYKDYLQTKIEALVNLTDNLLPEKIQQYKDAAEGYEKNFITVLAIVKKEQSLDQSVTEEDVNSFLI
ncbi:hypothetical protein AAKU52_002198 [Pedobacter sp. CG_S7]|uniref:hypothetical protein n=1 Tax=Pedobacter sp. CG_S7 TaxID=3143930 RepID=UPI0033955923